jgi:hypothetical protein
VPTRALMMEATNAFETSVNLYQTFAVYTVRCVERMSDSISNMNDALKIKV